MALDPKYIGGDTEVEDGNYVLEPGCVAKVARALAMEQVRIDGDLVGNGGYKALRRAGNTPNSRAIFKRYCEDVLRYFEDTGQIEDTAVATEGEDGDVRFLVAFRDKTTNTDVELITAPPWGV